MSEKCILYSNPFVTGSTSWHEPVDVDPSQYMDPILSKKINSSTADVMSVRFERTSEDYDHIALDIVNETVFDYPIAYVTEKTLRPIWNKRFFIVVGACNSLKQIQNLGFKTWNTFIDETYDTIPNPEQRWNAVCVEIEKFCSKPVEEVKDLLKKHEDVLEYNYKNLIELESKEKECLRSIL